ncbi:hypothetical protein D9M71_195350 [compost metagenome]
MGRLALAEHVVSLVEAEQVAAGEQFAKLFGIHGFEEQVGLQQLLVDQLRFHCVDITVQARLELCSLESGRH